MTIAPHQHSPSAIYIEKYIEKYIKHELVEVKLGWTIGIKYKCIYFEKNNSYGYRPMRVGISHTNVFRHYWDTSKALFTLHLLSPWITTPGKPREFY